MAGVIVQSKATSHVHRIFSALVVLLLLMAFAIGLSRVRSDQQGGSPYGTLTALAPAAPQDPVPAAAVTAVIHPKPAVPTPAADAAAPAPMSAPAPAQAAIAVAAPPQASLTPSATSVPLPAGTLALADAGKGPRRIALDKAAAGSAVPQPAPPAVVTAAAKAMTAPPPPAPVAPVAAPAAMVTPATAATSPATAALHAARKVAAVEDDEQAVPERRLSASGLVNINRASVDEMNHLGAGHIGAAIARGRPYRSIEDLVSRRVLKARDLARIEAGITTN